MPATTPGAPQPLQVPIREFGDLRNTVRVKHLSAGFDMAVLQQAFGILQAQPGYFDAQNIDPISHPGFFQLAPAWTQIDTDAADKQYLLYAFNNAVYRCPTANFDAAKFQKATQATGTPSWSAPAHAFPGSNAIRNAVVWQDQLVIAAGDTVLHVMSTAEAWSTIAAPGGVTAPVAGQVGVGQQDKIECWWEGSAGAGLWEYNGSTWTAIFPPTGVTLPVMPQCSLIYSGPGSLLFATYDATGRTQLYEYLILSTGTAIAVQIPAEIGLTFWPQAAATLGGQVYIGGRLGGQQNAGVLYGKATGSAPQVVFLMDTNYGTDSQKGLDWGIRCMLQSADMIHMGSSSRYDHRFANYRLELDDSGSEVIHPGSVSTSIDGPVYSLAMLPSAVAGASSGERLFASVAGATYYRDALNGSDPTKDAASGFLQYPDFDLGSPSHTHVWARALLALAKRAQGSSLYVDYRVDPRALSDAWMTLPAPSAGYVLGANKVSFPDDNAAQRLRGTAARVLQVRVRLTAATGGADRDLIDSLALRWARVRALGSSV